MDNKEDIDKLDRQINKLLNKEKEEKEKDLAEKREVIIDRKYAYDDIGDGDTKKIDRIEDVEEESVESEEPKTRVERLEEKESTKSRVERLEEQEEFLEEDKIDSDDKEEKPKKKLTKKQIIIICSIIGVILIAIVILLLVLNKNKKVDTDIDEKLSASEQKEIINDYGIELENVIDAYYNKQKVLLEYNDAVKLIDFDYNVKCNVHKIYNDGKVYINKCSINNIKTRYSYGEKQEEAKEGTDDKLKVYVNKTTKEASFIEPKNITQYDVYEFSIEGTYTDLALVSDKDSDYVYYVDEEHSVHMLNYKTGVKALNPLKYTNILPIKNEDDMDLSYVVVEMNNLWGIYNLDTRERIVNHNYKIIGTTQETAEENYVKTIDLDIVKVFDGECFGLINYKTGKEVVPAIYSAISRSGDYLYARDKNNNAHILDFSNKEYLKNYDKVYGIVDGKYSLVKDEKSIKMVKPDGKELFDYGEVEVSTRLRLANISDNEVYYIFVMSDEKTSEEDSDYLRIAYNTKMKKGTVEMLEYNDIFK